jgi:serine/threonine protein kinase
MTCVLFFARQSFSHFFPGSRRDTYHLENYQILANELAISTVLSSLVRRGICPNFIVIRGIFTAAFPPPEDCWGSDDDKCPNGEVVTYPIDPPTEPDVLEPGRFQYIRMELVNEGDAEELIKRQPDEVFPRGVARSILFQIAFALYAAADKFSVKHYDVKLLNIFIQRVDVVGDFILRYGLGSHVFALKMPRTHAFVAKLADFGTSNMCPDTNGLPVAIAHFTTLENTPFDFMVLGDDATQGHEHDSFGVGLCMLQLFTGSRPYEEILADVVCPPNLKRRLKDIWENECIDGYSVIRSIIFDGVDWDEEGNVVEGEPDQTFYHTLYRFLVLFGIPKIRFQEKTSPRVWKAISDTLEPSKLPRGQKGKPVRKRSGTDITQFCRDCKKFSIRSGNHPLIARAREALTAMEGGLDLLFSLCDLNPDTRATAMDVLNSTFMESLREDADNCSPPDDSATTYSFLSFAT